MRRLALSSFLTVTLLVGNAGALVWPDVPERVERDLSSTDALVRTSAAEKLDSLGSSRAVPLILRALGDGDVNVRIAAAETAARAHTPGATALVLAWLGEHDARLRIAACDVAHAIPDVRAVPLLARALSDADGAVRVHAIEALGVQGSRDAVPALLGKLDDPSPPVRVELARALGRIGDARAVVPLIGKVEDSVAEVRQAVAQALGELGDPRAAPAIALQLRDVLPEVRIVALAALAKVHGADTVDSVALLATERNVAVRQAALATLGALAKGGSDAALDLLAGRLGKDDDATADLEPSAVRDALVAAGANAVPPLRALIRGGGSPPSVTSAVWVLGALGATSASPDIVAALRRGTVPPVAALHALASAGTPDDLSVVLELASSDNTAVRAEALGAAKALLDPVHPDGRAVEPLIAVAQGSRLPTSDLVKVIELLGRTGASRAGATLQGFTHHHDTRVKLAAIDALGILGPTDSDASLLDLMTDASGEVRLHAADALSASGTAHARDALLHLLTAGSEVDRAAALTALRGILARAPSDDAVKQLRASLAVVVGAERDAVLLALAAGAPVRDVVSDLLAAAKDPEDRRTLLAGVAGRAESAPLARALLRDSDPSVRAEAAWSLGASAAGEEVRDLEHLAREKGTDAADAAIDAVGAIARIARRTHAAEATAALCTLVSDPRPLVRSNALTGLALVGARCGAGEAERTLLEAPSTSVRAAAARAVGASPKGAEDIAALTKCAARERSPIVGALCTHPSPPASGPDREVVVYIERPPHAGPGSRVPFVVELGDGLLRAGTADRRGAFFEPHAPPGVMRLHAPGSSQP